MTVDVIDIMLGPSAAMAVADLRATKPELASQMQNYYDSIFEPDSGSRSAFSKIERYLVAIRTAAHTGSESAVNWFVNCARESGADDASVEQATNVTTVWPGSDWMAAIMRHVDLITAKPAESSRSDIERLEQAGLSPRGIVVLSQVVAYVSYQVRLVATLRAIGEAK